MKFRKLSDKEYYDKVYACWLGKNIGGTLGGVWEGKKELLKLEFYTPVPKEPAINDDLDLQLVWLHAIQKYGLDLTANDLGKEWIAHIAYPFCEYGFAKINLRKGLLPPLTGSFSNWYTDCMGSPIRSEIWAAIAPGLPEVAVRYAYNDAIVDHGGEGVYGEIFFAALESAAFFENDCHKLIDIGLSFIPSDCKVSRVVRETVLLNRKKVDWVTARNIILKKYGHHDFTNAPQNIGFTILGWLYGNDFGDAILKAVNCGYDTDCTGATLASILGIIGGTKAIPKKWIEPIGDKIVKGWGVKDLNVPKDLQDLTKQTIEVGKQVLRKYNSGGYSKPKDKVIKHKIYVLPLSMDGLKIDVDYLGMPAIAYNKEKQIKIIVENKGNRKIKGNVYIRPPKGWNVRDIKSGTLDLLRNKKTEYVFGIKVNEGESKIDFSNPIVFGVKGTSGAKKEIKFVLVGETSWLVLGPVNVKKDLKKINEGMAKKHYFPEVSMKLSKFLSRRTPSACFMSTYATFPEKRKGRILAESTEKVKVWLNGRPVFDAEPVEHIFPSIHVAKAKAVFKKGRNEIMVKVMSNGKHSKPELNFIITDSEIKGVCDIQFNDVHIGW